MPRTAFAAAIVLAFAIPQPLFATGAEQECPAGECYAQEEARADLQHLHATLQGEAIGLYARRDKAGFDAKYEAMLAGIDGPVRRAQFHKQLQELLAFASIGHLKTEAPIGDVIARVQAGGAIIPLSVTYRDGAMVTDQWASKGEEMPPGSRITALGGLSTKDFEAAARALVSADTERLLRAQLEMALPVYLAMLFGEVDTLDVAFVRPDGTAGEERIPAVGFDAMYALQDARPVPAPPAAPSPRFAEDLGGGVFYLQPGLFFALESEKQEGDGTYAIAAYEEFLSGAFTALEASGASDLLIDLRGNAGGDASFSDLIMARVTDEPYRLWSRYEVRAGRNTKASWSDYEIDGNDLGDRIATALASAADGETVAIDVPQVAPMTQERFDGRVWVLIDRHSYSNAAVVAAAMQDTGMATLLGEETADLATTYGAVERFSLPHSGASIVYPKSYMVRPSGDETVRGVRPDIILEPRAVGESEDAMLNRALAAIVAAR